MVPLDAIVSEHLVGKQDLPIDHDQIQRVKAALLSGGVAHDPIQVGLHRHGRAEFGLGGMARRGDREWRAPEIRVNSGMLGEDLEPLRALGDLHAKGEWVDLAHPLVVRLVEMLHADRSPVQVNDGGWSQVGNEAVDMLMGDLFSPEATFYGQAHPEKKAQYSHMISFRKHVAASYAQELVTSAGIKALVHPKRVDVANQANAMLIGAGMIPAFRAAAAVFLEPVSLATEVLVSTAWNMAGRSRQANWPDGGGLPIQQGGKGLMGWRGPVLMSSLVYPVLAPENLKERLADDAPTNQVMRGQAVRSLMHEGIGPGDTDFDDRWKGMVVGMKQQQGPVVAITRLGHLLRDSFKSLEEAKLNLRVRDEVPPGLPGAIPFKDVSYEWGYKARRVKRKERKGRTSFSLVYALDSIGAVLSGVLGAPPPRGKRPDEWVPRLEISGVADNDGGLSVAAFIRGQAAGAPKNRLMELMKFHPVLFAQALHDLALNQGRGRVKLTAGQDSHFVRDYFSLPEPERVVEFVRQIIGGAEARLNKPLAIPLAARSNRSASVLTRLDAGTYRQNRAYPPEPVYPHTQLIPIERVDGDPPGYPLAIHHAELAEGKWQGVEADRWQTMLTVSGTADNETMPTLLWGLNVQARCEEWDVSPTEVVFRPNKLLLPHMLVNGQAASLDVEGDEVVLTLLPFLPGDDGVREVFTPGSQEAMAAAVNLRDTYRQLRMFGKYDESHWLGNLEKLLAMDGEARRLGLRLDKAVLRTGKDG